MVSVNILNILVISYPISNNHLLAI